MKPIILIVAFILTYFTILICGDAGVDIAGAGEGLAMAGDAMEKIKELSIVKNPGKLFAKIGNAVSALGPIFMAFSALTSIISIFLPQQDSPELKAIKKGFKKVNRKLDVISQDLKNMRSLVEMSNAKSAYAKYVTIINSNYRNLKETQETKTKESYRYFQTLYKDTFGMAHEHLYDAMIGANGELGFNYVKVYSKFAKCNPSSVANFCIMVIETINKGLSVEGAYLGAQNFTAKANAKKKMWAEKMSKLNDVCVKEIEGCEARWEEITDEEFNHLYKKEMSGDNKKYAKNIVLGMASIAPQRQWLAVCYNDASGFGEHCYGTGMHSTKIWDKNEKDVTLISGPRDEYKVKDAQFNKIKKAVDAQINAVGKVTRCRTGWTIFHKDIYHNNHARHIYSVIRKGFRGGVVYLVANNKSPGYSSIGGQIYAKNIKWKCTSHSFLLITYR